MGRVMRWAAAAVVGAFVMTGAACTDEPTQPSDLSDTTTSTDSSEAEAQQAVIEAYKGFFTALTNLADLSESNVRAALAPYGTGSAVENLVEVARILTAEGHVPAGSVVFSDISVELSSPNAIAAECRDTTTETIVDAVTGTVVSTGKPGTKFEVSLLFDSGEWKVTEYSAVEAGC